MNLQRARYLIALSDHGSFTRAAANVHVAQSALSQQIKVLERELGVPLVDRRGPQFTFTDAGRVAVREARFCSGVRTGRSNEFGWPRAVWMGNCASRTPARGQAAQSRIWSAPIESCTRAWRSSSIVALQRRQLISSEAER
ncbi:hypothetical protein GCM10020255_035570 [Rhodococcus baikonurensis]